MLGSGPAPDFFPERPPRAYSRAVNRPSARTAAAAIFAIAVVALAGCGGDEAGPPAPARGQAFDPQRTQDLVPLTTAQAARMADRIALVVAHGSRVVEGRPGTPFTRTTFAVRHVVKGRLPPEFVLQVIGGRLGDRFVTSPVQPFTPARRYVLFLGADGPAGPTIIPQAVMDVTGANVDPILASLKRYASTEGSP
jgi:hypothetical protein